MEGITDSAFRQLCREYGADVVYTEFISSDAIGHQAPSALRKMDFLPVEQPVVCQIFGKDPKAFQQSAREIEKRGFSGIDINLGCPARKVISHGSGVSLMRDPQYARNLIRSVLNVVSIPVSIKIRASIRRETKRVAPENDDKVTALDLVKALRDLPISAIMIHGRSFEQGFSGEPDTEMIRRCKEMFPGVVIANGGIQTADSALAMLRQTGADGIGIARGALGRPWIFSEILSVLRGLPQPTIKLPDVVLHHLELVLASKGPRAVVELRKHLSWYAKGHAGAAELRRGLQTVTTEEAVRSVVKLLA